MNQKNRSSETRHFINNAIRTPTVRCIDHEGNNLGEISLQDALRMAKSHNLDLVQLTPPRKDRNGQQVAPPTCKIMDFGKYRYNLTINKKESDKKQRANLIKLKEIKLRPNTDHNDVKTKAQQAENFLQKGYRVKIYIVFKGRQMAHQEVGYATLQELLSLIQSGVSESRPTMDDKNLTVILSKAEPTKKTS